MVKYFIDHDRRQISQWSELLFILLLFDILKQRFIRIKEFFIVKFSSIYFDYFGSYKSFSSQLPIKNKLAN